MMVRDIYYYFKPFIPRRLQILLRRTIVLRKRSKCVNIWPIDERADKLPEDWFGWPNKKRFAVVLTHDVETSIGQGKCIQLASLEESLGFRSSFNFVAQAYNVSPELRDFLHKHGFEVGVHGLRHDGNLYRSRESFQKQAGQINGVLEEWGAVGFRSPSMYHNLDWLHDLNIKYDASSFDTDPFEPQPDGMRTLFPFWVEGKSSEKGYVELPYTLPQDFTLFVLMRERGIEIWRRKLDWIVEHGGMALLNTHPDYMAFGGDKPNFQEYPSEYYEKLLRYIKDKYNGQYWNVLPKDISELWSRNLKRI